MSSYSRFMAGVVN